MWLTCNIARFVRATNQTIDGRIFHYHLHHQEKGCWEKCSKSCVFGRPKRRQQEMLRSEVLVSFVLISDAITISRTRAEQYVNPERQRIRAEHLRRNTRRFRVLIIGRANAGKTTILQRVCNTTEQPKIFNPQGYEVCVKHITWVCHCLILLID